MANTAREMLRTLMSRFRPASQQEDRESYGTSRHLVQLLVGLIDTFDYQSFLEIGTYKGFTSEAVARHMQERSSGATIVTVDPKRWVTLPSCIDQKVMTSDVFFAQDHRRYDLILVDGDHAFEAALRDLQNSLARLSAHGTIVMHDLVSCSGVATLMRTLDRGLLDVINFEYQVGISLIRFTPLIGPVNTLTASRVEFVDARLPYIREHRFSETSQIMADILLSWYLPPGQTHKEIAAAVARAESAFRELAMSSADRAKVIDRMSAACGRLQMLDAMTAPVDFAFTIEELLLLACYFEQRFGEPAPIADSIRVLVKSKALPESKLRTH
jgi:Methyltransferase domain